MMILPPCTSPCPACQHHSFMIRGKELSLGTMGLTSKLYWCSLFQASCPGDVYHGGIYMEAPLSRASNFTLYRCVQSKPSRGCLTRLLCLSSRAKVQAVPLAKPVQKLGVLAKPRSAAREIARCAPLPLVGPQWIWLRQRTLKSGGFMT